MASYLLAGLLQAWKVLVSCAASEHAPQGVHGFNFYHLQDSRLQRRQQVGEEGRKGERVGSKDNLCVLHSFYWDCS